jgi:hypothetical protein
VLGPARPRARSQHHAVERLGERPLVVHVGGAEDRGEGMPLPSVSRWRFTPRFARSVGFGPVRSPPLAP